VVAVVPTSLAEALDALAERPDATVLAGGTDLMVEINAGRRRPDDVVALRRVPELKQLTIGPDEVRIGAGVSYTRLLQPDVAAVAPALAQAARTVGSPQIRNAGTIGGNLATASPAGDTLPVLFALDARVEVANRADSRSVPISAFITGPKRTVIAPGELIIAVSVPVASGPQAYRKVGVRNAMVIAIASMAFVVSTNRRVAVGLGSVGPGPLRAPDAEEFATNAEDWSDPDIADRFGALVAGASLPIDDHRSTAAYRRHAIGVLAARCLRAAA
jgi:CO/xanthine dehydrogenase FAD-binding subunit